MGWFIGVVAILALLSTGSWFMIFGAIADEMQGEPESVDWDYVPIALVESAVGCIIALIAFREAILLTVLIAFVGPLLAGAVLGTVLLLVALLIS